MGYIIPDGRRADPLSEPGSITAEIEAVLARGNPVDFPIQLATRLAPPPSAEVGELQPRGYRCPVCHDTEWGCLICR
jgi:hypothetical protein